MHRLRNRILIPAVDLIVAATTVGLLVLVTNDSDAAPAQGRDGVNAPTAVETEIGNAVVQERLPDGTPGPVQTRSTDPPVRTAGQGGIVVVHAHSWSVPAIARRVDRRGGHRRRVQR